MTKSEARAKARSIWLLTDWPESWSGRLISILSSCERIIAYYPLPDELQIGSILNGVGCPVYLPVIEGPALSFRLYRDGKGGVLPLTAGPFGVRQPVEGPVLAEVTNKDAVLVPALGCNPDGFRLGRGGGYYDRSRNFLGPARKIALLPEQCARLSFTAEPHDMRLDLILTENKTISL